MYFNISDILACTLRNTRCDFLAQKEAPLLYAVRVAALVGILLIKTLPRKEVNQ